MKYHNLFELPDIWFEKTVKGKKVILKRQPLLEKGKVPDYAKSKSD